MNNESVRQKNTVLVAVMALLLTAFTPFLILSDGADAGESGSDLSIYRYTPKLTVTTDDPASVEYIVWDFGDGTVLDGRWEYYIKQQNEGVGLSEEIVAGIDAYKQLLEENGNSLWVTTHTYANKGTYTVTAVAINALGYVPEGGNPYDGSFYVDETGFDGGLFYASSMDVTSPSDSDLNDSDFKAVAGSWCRVLYTVDILGYPTITFDSNGGSSVDSVTVENTSEYVVASKPSDPVREGHQFLGWFTDEECTHAYDWDLRVEAPMTLYAGWISATEPVYDHIITFMDGDAVLGTQNLKNDVNGSVSITVSQDVPSKEGYTFKGWSDVKGSPVVKYQNGSVVSVSVAGCTLYAIWEKDPVPVDDVTITVDGKDVIVEDGKTVGDLTVPTKDGFEFEGWYSDSGFTQKLSEDTVLIDGMTLFSKFTEKKDSDDGSSVLTIVLLVAGALVVIVGFRYHPVIVLAGIILAMTAVLDMAGIIELFWR